MKIWVIKHLFSPPYNPASNGLAEKAVHIIKDKLKKNKAPAQPLPLQAHLADILHVHRGTVHSTMGYTTFHMMRTATVPSLFPNLQLKQKDNVAPAKSGQKV